MRINEELNSHIRQCRKLWRTSKDMIIIRTHTYLNEKQVDIIGDSCNHGVHLIEYMDGKKRHLFYAKKRHKLNTVLPDGRKMKTTVFTGLILRNKYET